MPGFASIARLPIATGRRGGEGVTLNVPARRLGSRRSPRRSWPAPGSRCPRRRRRPRRVPAIAISATITVPAASTEAAAWPPDIETGLTIRPPAAATEAAVPAPAIRAGAQVAVPAAATATATLAAEINARARRVKTQIILS